MASDQPSADQRATPCASDDCLEGCDGDHVHKWEIEPHPQTDEADVLVVDDDSDALEFLQSLAEQVWDDIEPGEERVIKIRRNKVAGDE